MPKPNAKPAKSAKPDALATLKKLQAKDPGLKRLLEKAYGYAVFPAVGKANLVIGGAFGRGEVFEKGRKIGYATISLLTIGVQIGGDTFDEVIVFESREALERFKRGKTAFSANASAVLVKAGAASAKDFEKGAAVYVYPHGGMMLELGIGGQRFKFKPADEEQQQDEDQGEQGSGRSGAKSKGKGAQSRGQEDEGDEEEQDEGEADESDEGEEGETGEEEASAGGGNRALELAGRAVGGVRSAASKAKAMVKRHPVAATLAGVGLATGLGMLIARAVRGSGDAEGGEEDQDAGGEEEEQDEGAQDSLEDSADDSEDDSAEDSAEDSGEEESDEDEDQDQGEEDEGEEDEQDDGGEEEAGNRSVLSRLLSRGKSRA